MPTNTLKIGIIGGGAAGFFAALSAKKHWPKAEVVVLEKSTKFLAKVKVSGGGRCNVTHAAFDTDYLASHYPRGARQLRRAFHQFNAKDTVEWFESRGVPLHTYPDGCIFPEANDSQVIIDCLMAEAKLLGVRLYLQEKVQKIEVKDANFEIISNDKAWIFDRVIVTTGGQPKRASLEWLEVLGHKLVEPVPSLFTFNMPKHPICELMGIVVPAATARIEGTKLSASGPLLITHWGMSGPAILLLSAWGARILHEKNYNFRVLIQWLARNEQEVQQLLDQAVAAHGAKKICNYKPFDLQSRLWNYLLQKSEISPELRWNELGKKNRNKLCNTLLNDAYEVQGKTTFKEEFVTAGGIDLSLVDIQTMQSKVLPGLFFAGELLDIDGVTGGFNFQAAWTTGFIAGKSAGESA
ncbi:MAG: hypothetical protein RLZZ301_1449 [Bacteroidota bacterium]|jgi:predicted Rossmann fold flavoprotein